jgi:hypothetical protein
LQRNRYIPYQSHISQDVSPRSMWSIILQVGRDTTSVYQHLTLFARYVGSHIPAVGLRKEGEVRKLFDVLGVLLLGLWEH